MSSLRLRPLESDDVPVVAALLSHPDLVGRRGLENDRPWARSVAALTKVLEPMIDSEDGATWVADYEGVIGLAMADWWWDALTPWAHVVIAPEHQRQGHGSTVMRMVLDQLFMTTPALLVQCSAPSWDEVGLAFAQSLGVEVAGRKRRVGVRHGAYFDSVEFALSRATWEARYADRR